jgi:hypothetical protein
MSFRNNGFHNTRAYEPDPPTPAPGLLSSAIVWVRQKFDKLLRSGASSSISAVTPFSGDEGPYSLLGSEVRDRPSDRADSTVFPMAERDAGFHTKLRPARVNSVHRPERRAER